MSAELRKEYEDRLDYELVHYQEHGISGYFLIVADFIKWSKDNDIPGSWTGFWCWLTCCYCLTITDLDHSVWLAFERFLNPERVSMPDFDIDFCQDRREEVLICSTPRVSIKYPKSTFGEIKAKNALKDAGRVIIHDKFGGYGFGETNEYTKLIPKKEDS